MRTHVIALAASVAALTTTATPWPATAQGLGLGSLFSCRGSQGTTGAVVGGVAGAVLGSQVSKNERGLGAVVGAGLGAWAGNQLACRMNTSGRSRAERAMQRALDTGRPQSWYDSRTRTSGRVELVSDAYAGAASAGGYGRPVASADLRYAAGVERAYDLASGAPLYRSDRRVNVRAAPSTQAPVVDRLRPGETIAAAGVTPDGWIAVQEDGLVRGYVAASVVRPTGGAAYAGASGDCRVVRQTISAPGYGTETQRFNACREAGGQWRLEPI